MHSSLETPETTQFFFLHLFLAVQGLSLVAAYGLLIAVPSLVVADRFSCPLASKIFLDQG